MNEKHLRYFLTVYNYCNISKAAEEIHISRQALSKIIHDLESEINCKLFIRDNTGLHPTDAGHELYIHADRIIHEFNSILQINYLENIRSHEVSIYTLDAFTDCLDAEFFISFHQKYPDIIINMQETTDQDAKDKLLLQKCDLAIVTDAVDMSNVKKTFLFRSQYCVLINNANPLRRKEYIQAEDYRGQLVIGKGQTLKYYWRDMNFTIRTGSNYAFFVELNNTSLREKLVRMNAGIAVAWDYTLLSRRPVQGCTIRPMYKAGFGCDLYLIEREGEMTSPRRLQIVKLVKEEICHWIQSHLSH